MRKLIERIRWWLWRERAAAYLRRFLHDAALAWEVAGEMAASGMRELDEHPHDAAIEELGYWTD